MPKRIRPRRGNCLVELLPPDDKTFSGLFLPDIAHDRIQGEKEKPFKGLVVEMGAWKLGRNGRSIMPDFGVGTIVLCSPYKGTQLGLIVWERLRLVDFDDVLAIVRE